MAYTWIDKLKIMFKTVSIITLVFSFSLLSGCSREPSQEDLHRLYVEKINQTNRLAEKITQQKGTIITVKSFEKIDCNKVSETKDYLCRANVTVMLPFLGDQKNTAELRVTKGENGWIALD